MQDGSLLVSEDDNGVQYHQRGLTDPEAIPECQLGTHVLHMESVPTINTSGGRLSSGDGGDTVSRDRNREQFENDPGRWEDVGDDVRTRFGNAEAGQRRRYGGPEQQSFNDGGEGMMDDSMQGGRYDRYSQDDRGGMWRGSSNWGRNYDEGPREYGQQYGRQGYSAQYGGQGFGPQQDLGRQYGGKYGGQGYAGPYRGQGYAGQRYGGEFDGQGQGYGGQYEGQGYGGGYRGRGYGGEYRGPDYGRQDYGQQYGQRDYGQGQYDNRFRGERWGGRNAPSEMGWRSSEFGGHNESGPAYGMHGNQGEQFHGTRGMPSNAGRGPEGYQRSDERIKEDVHEALTWDHDVDASNIQVKVENGEVTLEGTVHDRQQKRAAEDALEDVRGVTDVHNQLRVEPQDSEHRQGSSSQGNKSGSARESGRSSLQESSSGTQASGSHDKNKT